MVVQVQSGCDCKSRTHLPFAIATGPRVYHATSTPPPFAATRIVADPQEAQRLLEESPAAQKEEGATSTGKASPDTDITAVKTIRTHPACSQLVSPLLAVPLQSCWRHLLLAQRWTSSPQHSRPCLPTISSVSSASGGSSRQRTSVVHRLDLRAPSRSRVQSNSMTHGRGHRRLWLLHK